MAVPTEDGFKSEAFGFEKESTVLGFPPQPYIMVTPPTPREPDAIQQILVSNSCTKWLKVPSREPRIHPSFIRDYGQPLGGEQISLMVSATKIFAELVPLERVEAATRAPWQKAMDEIHKRRSRGRLHDTKSKVAPIEGLHPMVTSAFSQPFDSYEVDMMTHASSFAPAYDAAYKKAEPVRQKFKKIRAELKASMTRMGSLFPQDGESRLSRQTGGLQIGEGPSLTKQAKEARDDAYAKTLSQKQRRMLKTARKHDVRGEVPVGNKVTKRSGRGDMSRPQRDTRE